MEGSPLADGAGPSIWHTFAHTPGRIENGETADVTCDQYNRYLQDVELMRDLGFQPGMSVEPVRRRARKSVSSKGMSSSLMKR